jgi:peptidoglycan/LPS O-acetylase OafA/YrhL
MQSAKSLPQKRLDIEGLRAVCVAAVLLYHLDIQAFSGGFIGVDIFFVLSGFVITGQIIQSLATQPNIDLTDFLYRRAWRLLPSAFLVASVSLVLAGIFLSPFVTRDIFVPFLSTQLFFSNWYFGRSRLDYLDSDNTSNVFLHFWSLSIEQQFYIAWPLLIFAVFFFTRRQDVRFKLRLLLFVIAGLSIISFLFSLSLITRNVPMAFFGSHARFWQLGTGCACALAVSLWPNLIGQPVWKVLYAVAAFVIGLCLATFGQVTVYPGIYAALPTVAAAIMLIAGHQTDQPLQQAFSAKPLVNIGNMSYVIYLWHWPVIVFMRHWMPDQDAFVVTAIVLVTLALSYATHRWVEKPGREFGRNNRLGARPILLSGAAMLATALLATGIGTHAIHTPLKLDDQTEISLDEIVSAISKPQKDGCHASTVVTTLAPCIYGQASSQKTVMLFGDSHALHWFDAIEPAAKRYSYRFINRTKDACPPINAMMWDSRRNAPYIACQKWQEKVLAEIQALNPDVIILAGASSYEKMSDNGRMQFVSQSPDIRNNGLLSMIKLLRAPKRKLVAVTGTPVYQRPPIECLFANPARTSNCTLPEKEVRPDSPFPFVPEALPTDIEIFDPYPLLCPQGRCVAVLFGWPVNKDSGHLSPKVTAQLSYAFDRYLVDQRL